MQVTRSVLSPMDSACKNTPFCYRSPYILPTVSDILGIPPIHEYLLSPNRRTCLQVCFLNNCRISELLSMTNLDILPADRAICHGSKRSNSYIIFLPGICSQVDDFDSPDTCFYIFPFSYMQLYRDCIKAGICSITDSLHNKRRLHSSRYSIATSLRGRVDDASLSHVLRHRSKSSISYYT